MANSRKLNSDLQEHVASVLSPFVPCGSSLLLGLSGGVDSVVLLHVLVQLSPRFSWCLSALHVHHGISSHADDWETFCTGFCAQYAIPLQVERVDLAPLREMGIEAAARTLRHEALARQAVDFIALAHHRDDQAETLLLQLLRGTGVRGASAMPVIKSVRGAASVLRPLLNIDRGELLVYARQHGLGWVEDDSNRDISYPRNFLRHRVLPELERRFPAYRSTLTRSSGNFAEAAGLLDELAAQDAGTAIIGGQLSVAMLRQFSHARGKNLLRYFLASKGSPIPDSTRLTEMLRQLCEAGEGAQIRITWQNWQLRCYREHVYVLPVRVPSAGFSVAWQGEGDVQLPEPHGRLRFVHATGAGLGLSRLRQGEVTIRSRQGGEYVQLDTLRPRQSLRNLLPQNAIPPWQRELLPLIFCDENLVFVPGVATAHGYAAQEGEPGVLVEWQSLDK